MSFIEKLERIIEKEKLDKKEKKKRTIIRGRSERIYETVEARDTPREVLETIIWILAGKTKRSNKVDYYLTIAKLALEKAKKIDEKRYQEFIQTLKGA